MANVVSVNISERKGEQKHPVPEIQLKFRHGIVGDAHAGDWHRQISLLAEESVDTMRASCPIPLDPGVFAENINTEGIDLKHLPVGKSVKVVPVNADGKEITGANTASNLVVKSYNREGFAHFKYAGVSLRRQQFSASRSLSLLRSIPFAAFY